MLGGAVKKISNYIRLSSTLHDILFDIKFLDNLLLSNKENLKIIELKLPDSINIPSIFIAGEADWGIYQKPRELKKMETKFFSNYFGTKIIKEAGHWVQQEKPKETYNCIINLIKSIGY
mgnify:CR=1 FL=1